MNRQRFCGKGACLAVGVVPKGCQTWRIGVALVVPVVAMTFFMTLGFILPIFGASGKEPVNQRPSVEIPPEYQDKQMPKGWRMDPKVLTAGKAIYEGTANPEVDCASCHGIDGKPTRKGRGAPDLSDPVEAQVSDARWFWEISEGKRRTKMQGHEKHLSEEERWQVIAYMRTFAQSSD